MKRILTAIVLAVIMCLFPAMARSYLAIDDSGVDYFDTDVSKAWLGLEYVDGQLVVLISQSAFDGAIAIPVDFDVPELTNRTDFFGNEMNADIGDISDMRWTGVNDDSPYAHYIIGFVATHLDTTVSDAIAEYQAVLGTMGFESHVADTATPSVKIMTFSNGEDTLEARLTQRRGDVIVDLKSL